MLGQVSLHTALKFVERIVSVLLASLKLRDHKTVGAQYQRGAWDLVLNGLSTEFVSS